MMQGREYQDHPHLCKPWSTSQLLKALGLAPWPTDSCAKSLLLPTHRGTVPQAKRQGITVLRQQQEPHTPVQSQWHSWTKLLYLEHQQLPSPVSEQIKTTTLREPHTCSQKKNWMFRFVWWIHTLEIKHEPCNWGTSYSHLLNSRSTLF